VIDRKETFENTQKHSNPRGGQQSSSSLFDWPDHSPEEPWSSNQRMFSWALPSGELGGLPGEFYQFANSIRSELSTVSVRPLKEAG
jgi:hypothetical protein